MNTKKRTPIRCVCLSCGAQLADETSPCKCESIMCEVCGVVPIKDDDSRTCSDSCQRALDIREAR